MQSTGRILHKFWCYFIHFRYPCHERHELEDKQFQRITSKYKMISHVSMRLLVFNPSSTPSVCPPPFSFRSPYMFLYLFPPAHPFPLLSSSSHFFTLSCSLISASSSLSTNLFSSFPPSSQCIPPSTLLLPTHII